MLTHDTRALIAWLRGDEYLSVEDILGGIRVPCLFYCGENDGSYSEAQRAAREIPGASFVGIPGGGHLEGGTWINILLPHIQQIVNSI
jgi:pimeloyl-ACP methyl ester carboxylesterase